LVRPSKADSVINKRPDQYAWYQHDVNIAENALVGPFDFAKEHTIPNEAWDRLQEKAAEQKVDVSSAFERLPI
jgi:hypothetical protein